MKLVDILARELKVWPHLGERLSQGHRGHVYPSGGGNHYAILELAEDWVLAEISRTQWQAAVDALKDDECAHSYGNKQGCPECGEVFKTEWTGDGPPPVGTECEFHGTGAACPDDPWHPDLKDGDHVTIIAYFSDSIGQIAAFTFKARNENIAAIQVGQARPGAFKPIRTPEQIEKEEREKAINELTYCHENETLRAWAVYAYDTLGYRKQAKP